jgi:surfeit locus 1 family protein
VTRRRAGRLVLPALCLFFAALFGALGVWQVQRLQWKLDLIERVETRLGQAPVPAPIAGDPKAFEYRPVRANGTFLHDRETLVQALTERGAGYWVMTPLRTGGGLILINRGFVPEDRRDAASRPQGPVRVNGLLRLSEPGGRFLRPNRPAEKRWYSRDVDAIAKARGVGPVAPYFIDAEASPAAALPVGGLTVVRFRNAHLIYALTWFGLAAMSVFGFALARRQSSGEKVP